MTAPRAISDDGLAFIKAREGLRLKAAPRGDGRFIIGYSHLQDADEPAEVSIEAADDLLRSDLAVVEAVVNDGVHAAISQRQFDALVSFAFSIGVDVFRESGVADALNAGRPLEAAAVFDRYCAARLGGRLMVVDALVRRRADERAMFLNAGDAATAAPSAVLRAEPMAADELEAALGHPSALDIELDRFEIDETDEGPREAGAAGPGQVLRRLRRIAPELFEPSPAARSEHVALPEARPEPPASTTHAANPGELDSARERGAEGVSLRAEWPWWLGGAGLAATGVGTYQLVTGSAAAASGTGWRLAVLAGVIALSVSGYRALRRRFESPRPPA